MKKQSSIIILSAFLLAINLSSCKKNEQAQPVETQEVKNLKQFYANIAKVNIGYVNYAASKDEFSINGIARISHSDLSQFYNASKNTPTAIHFKATSVTFIKNK